MAAKGLGVRLKKLTIPHVNPDKPYPLTKPKLGKAVIVNNVHSEQPGSRADVEALKETYERIGLEVEVHNDCDYKKMARIKRKIIANEMHEDSNMFVLSVICHGNNQGLLLDVDRKRAWVTEDILTDISVIEALVGKPKILVLQSCRGSERSGGTQHLGDDGDMDPVTLPDKSDMFVAYATVPGYRAHAGDADGSAFIQGFSAYLERHFKTHDLDAIYSMVNQYMAGVEQGESADKQVSEKRSSLRFPLRFSEFQGKSQGIPKVKPVVAPRPAPRRKLGSSPQSPASPTAGTQPQTAGVQPPPAGAQPSQVKSADRQVSEDGSSFRLRLSQWIGRSQGIPKEKPVVRPPPPPPPAHRPPPPAGAPPPTARTQQPPAEAQPSPPAGAQQPPAGAQQPPAGAQPPPARAQQPPAGASPPPTAGVQQQPAGAQQPPAGAQPPTARAQPPPPAGEQQPPVGAQPPPARAQPPPAGEQQPPAGEQQPPAGAQPPPAGAQPPPAGAQPPPTGAQPAQSVTQLNVKLLMTYNTGLVSWGGTGSTVMETGHIVLNGKTSEKSPEALHMFLKGAEGFKKVREVKGFCEHEGSVHLEPLKVKDQEFLAVSCYECHKIRLYDMISEEVTTAFYDPEYRPGKMSTGEDEVMYVVHMVRGVPILKLNTEQNPFTGPNETVQSGMEGVCSMLHIPAPHNLLVISHFLTAQIRAVSSITGEEKWELRGEVDGEECDPHGMFFSQDHQALLVADGRNRRILVLNPRGGSVIKTIQLYGGIGHIFELYIPQQKLMFCHHIHRKSKVSILSIY